MHGWFIRCIEIASGSWFIAMSTGLPVASYSVYRGKREAVFFFKNVRIYNIGDGNGAVIENTALLDGFNVVSAILNIPHIINNSVNNTVSAVQEICVYRCFAVRKLQSYAFFGDSVFFGAVFVSVYIGYIAALRYTNKAA